MSSSEEQVIVYTQPRCGQCDATKRALSKYAISFREIDLTTNPEELSRLKAAGWLRAPVIKTPDGQAWSGFRPDRIAGLANPKGALDLATDRRVSRETPNVGVSLSH